jgi:hypothetical protein
MTGQFELAMHTFTRTPFLSRIAFSREIRGPSISDLRLDFLRRLLSYFAHIHSS